MSPNAKGKTRRPSVSSPMIRLSRTLSSASTQSVPHPPSRPVRITEPPFADPVEALALPRSDMLSAGAIVVRIRSRRPESLCMFPDLLATSRVRSLSPGRSFARHCKDRDDLDPQSVPYAPSRPVRITEPPFADPVEALALPRSDMLSAGAIVVRIRCRRPESLCMFPDLLATSRVRSLSPGRSFARHCKDRDDLDPQSVPYAPSRPVRITEPPFADPVEALALPRSDMLSAGAIVVRIRSRRPESLCMFPDLLATSRVRSLSPGRSFARHCKDRDDLDPQSVPYAPSRPVRITEPPFADPVEALALPRSDMLSAGAIVVRIRCRRPESLCMFPDLLATSRVRSLSPGRSFARHRKDHDGLDRPDSQSLPLNADIGVEYLE
ncbi:hypothetical protein L226DRAFT_292565 [Lentinus tigrinus ALCF2SS1-7]|uniref:uncharacterized protein n=1 Tax=Lentinus tigrinus ALCF2SS1-7 TaxID=1328758 RepID=UPI001166388B|nr:hypothetical protein L226DRAFT_292565 [Lentinus tigrinus ALCF2SS1-7]